MYNGTGTYGPAERYELRSLASVLELRLRDRDDARSEAYLRLFGVLLGGFGFGMALFEAAHVCTRASRHCPLDAP